MRATALEWLRYKRQCPLVAMERGPVDGNPDVLGMTKDRRLIEIEIKISRGDFRRDRLKRKHRHEAWSAAAQFYWFVPPDMVEWARGELWDGEGLMSYGAFVSPYSGIPLPIFPVVARRRSKEKMTDRQLVSMAMAAAGTMVSMAVALANANAQEDHEEDHEEEEKSLTP